jgi:hypothetical protein
MRRREGIWLNFLHTGMTTSHFRDHNDRVYCGAVAITFGIDIGHSCLKEYRLLQEQPLSFNMCV